MSVAMAGDQLDRVKERLQEWTRTAVTQETFDVPDVSVEGIKHSESVDDVFRFIAQTFTELPLFQYNNPSDTADVLCAVVEDYCILLVDLGKDELRDELAKVAASPSPRGKKSKSKRKLNLAKGFGVSREFYVRLNNVFRATETRLGELSYDASPILGPLAGPDQPVFQALSNKFANSMLRIRKRNRRLLDLLLSRADSSINSELIRLIDVKASNPQWQEFINCIDSLLVLPSEMLYDKLFTRLLQQMCTRCFKRMESLLKGDIDAAVELQSPGAAITAMMDGAELLREFFVADGDGLSRSFVDKLAGPEKPLQRLLFLHAQPTAVLQSMHDAATKDAKDATEQAYMIQYALASRTHDSEAIDYCRSHGISMVGPVPSAFKLPDSEVLQLRSACSLGSTVGMFYLTSSFVCFESTLPADEDDAADAESAKTCFPIREIANCRHQSEAGKSSIHMTLSDATVFTLDAFKSNSRCEEYYKTVLQQSLTAQRTLISDASSVARGARLVALCDGTFALRKALPVSYIYMKQDDDGIAYHFSVATAGGKERAFSRHFTEFIALDEALQALTVGAGTLLTLPNKREFGRKEAASKERKIALPAYLNHAAVVFDVEKVQVLSDFMGADARPGARRAGAAEAVTAPR